MSLSEQKTSKNCLLAFASKRAADLSVLSALVNGFSSRGIVFDRAAQIAFDDSVEIARAVTEGIANYDNVVISCPKVMEQTLKNFIAQNKGCTFDGTGQLNAGNFSAFLLSSDGECFLTVRKIADVLDEKYGVRTERAFIKTVGAPQTAVTDAIESARKVCEGLRFNVREKFGDSSIEIVYSDLTPKSAFDNAVRAMLSKLNDYVYALDDSSLAERLFDLLKLRRMKIGVAESFTGGGVCKRLVEIPGVSEVFYEGLNTYSNQAKTKRLGVSEECLRAYGAVSEEVATQMAEGLLRDGNCDVAIATTGIAGPASDNTHKPVGLCYIAVGVRENVNVYKFNLKGDREKITETAVNLALFLAFRIMK